MISACLCDLQIRIQEESILFPQKKKKKKKKTWFKKYLSWSIIAEVLNKLYNSSNPLWISFV
jgi:hypothetical protein